MRYATHGPSRISTSRRRALGATPRRMTPARRSGCSRVVKPGAWLRQVLVALELLDPDVVGLLARVGGRGVAVQRRVEGGRGVGDQLERLRDERDVQDLRLAEHLASDRQVRELLDQGRVGVDRAAAR